MKDDNDCGCSDAQDALSASDHAHLRIAARALAKAAQAMNGGDHTHPDFEEFVDEVHAHLLTGACSLGYCLKLCAPTGDCAMTDCLSACLGKRGHPCC